MKLIEKLKKVFTADELWWHNAETAGEWSIEEMFQAEDAARMSPIVWENFSFMRGMSIDDIIHAAWYAGYVPPMETPDETKKRYDWKFDAARNELYSRGFRIYYAGGQRSARMQDALKLLEEDKYIHVIFPMRKAGYTVDVPDSAKEEYDKLLAKREAKERTLKAKYYNSKNKVNNGD